MRYTPLILILLGVASFLHAFAGVGFSITAGYDIQDARGAIKTIEDRMTEAEIRSIFKLAPDVNTHDFLHRTFGMQRTANMGSIFAWEFLIAIAAVALGFGEQAARRRTIP